MKRQRSTTSPDVYYLKLRKKYERYSTSAWGCLRKKYPVVCVGHAWDMGAVGHTWASSAHAANFFGLSYHQIHKCIERGRPVQNQYVLNYKKFL